MVVLDTIPPLVAVTHQSVVGQPSMIPEEEESVSCAVAAQASWLNMADQNKKDIDQKFYNEILTCVSFIHNRHSYSYRPDRYFTNILPLKSCSSYIIYRLHFLLRHVTDTNYDFTHKTQEECTHILFVLSKLYSATVLTTHIMRLYLLVHSFSFSNVTICSFSLQKVIYKYTRTYEAQLHIIRVNYMQLCVISYIYIYI